MTSELSRNNQIQVSSTGYSSPIFHNVSPLAGTPTISTPVGDVYLSPLAVFGKSTIEAQPASERPRHSSLVATGGASPVNVTRQRAGSSLATYVPFHNESITTESSEYLQPNKMAAISDSSMFTKTQLKKQLELRISQCRLDMDASYCVTYLFSQGPFSRFYGRWKVLMEMRKSAFPIIDAENLFNSYVNQMVEAIHILRDMHLQEGLRHIPNDLRDDYIVKWLNAPNNCFVKEAFRGAPLPSVESGLTSMNLFNALSNGGLLVSSVNSTPKSPIECLKYYLISTGRADSKVVSLELDGVRINVRQSRVRFALPAEDVFSFEPPKALLLEAGQVQLLLFYRGHGGSKVQSHDSSRQRVPPPPMGESMLSHTDISMILDGSRISETSHDLVDGKYLVWEVSVSGDNTLDDVRGSSTPRSFYLVLHLADDMEMSTLSNLLKIDGKHLKRVYWIVGGISRLLSSTINEDPLSSQMKKRYRRGSVP